MHDPTEPAPAHKPRARLPFLILGYAAVSVILILALVGTPSRRPPPASQPERLTHEQHVERARARADTARREAVAKAVEAPDEAIAADTRVRRTLRNAAGSPTSADTAERMLRELGFSFESAPLADGTPRRLGQHDTTLVELYHNAAGHVTQAVVVGIASQDNESINQTIAVGMLGVLRVFVPSKVAWLTPTMQRAVADAEQNGKGTASTAAHGVVVALVVDATLGTFVLTVQHPANKMQRGG